MRLALFEKAVAAHRAGRLEEAERLYLRILEDAADDAGALSNLGRIARSRGDLDAAIALYRRAAQNPDAPAQVHYNLGNALRDFGDRIEAAAAYRRALSLSPDFKAAAEALRRCEGGGEDPDALTRRASDLFLKGEGDAAAALLQRAARLRPDDPTTLQNLGYFYRSTGHYRKAIAAYEEAAKASDADLIRVEIANCLINIGEPDDARTALGKLLPTPQGRRAAASSYLMSLLYDPAAAPAFIRDEHRRLTKDWPCRKKGPPRRRSKALRVGYLTADFFGQHPVAQFLAPLIERHKDKALGVESIAYDAKPRGDSTAARMGALIDVVSIEGLSDEEAADRIRRDDLDLLIDLSGHTSGRRLPVLGLRPASATASFLGYPSTTGFAGVGWLIGDGRVFPQGADDLYTERLARLPQSFLAFDPPQGMLKPAQRRIDGPVVFGSLNHYPKINDGVVDVWASILAAAPGSKLLLQCAAFAEQESVAETARRFAARNIGQARLNLQPPQPFEEAMRRYHEIDIALDPFPYNGGTTTAHALFMGVPVVALEGAYFCGRMGASLLAAANRPEWLAKTIDDYVAVAARLADRISAGEDVRGALLRSNASAPLFDLDAYARDVAALYREIVGGAA